MQNQKIESANQATDGPIRDCVLPLHDQVDLLKVRGKPTFWGRLFTSIALPAAWGWRVLKVGCGRFVQFVSKLSPAQKLILGFFWYVMAGVFLLSLPVSQTVGVSFLDNLFTAVSAVSTTGLVTVATGDSYSFWGELVVMCLFQLGGIGFMTVSSFLLLASGKSLNEGRQRVLLTGFSLPSYFNLKHFIVQVIVFSLVIEALGAIILWWEFSNSGVENPIWFAIFHSVSAFATAGFGLRSNSLEDFSDNVTVNVVISVLAYLGAVGFIVLQDVYYSLKYREHLITFTSKLILTMTALVLVVSTGVIFAFEPLIGHLPWLERLMVAAFQAGAASSTSGFNTIPIGQMSVASILVLIVAMVIGASPSGTGGGVKTTTVSALWGAVMSLLRGRSRASLLGHEIPENRLLQAAAVLMLYLVSLTITTVALACVQTAHAFDKLLFETASALGTVGLSMGITGEMSDGGKWILIGTMFLGRVGPLTLAMALAYKPSDNKQLTQDDVAI